jgi:hypothetical protein
LPFKVQKLCIFESLEKENTHPYQNMYQTVFKVTVRKMAYQYLIPTESLKRDTSHLFMKVTYGHSGFFTPLLPIFIFGLCTNLRTLYNFTASCHPLIEKNSTISLFTPIPNGATVPFKESSKKFTWFYGPEKKAEKWVPEIRRVELFSHAMMQGRITAINFSLIFS